MIKIEGIKYDLVEQTEKERLIEDTPCAGCACLGKGKSECKKMRALFKELSCIDPICRNYDYKEIKTRKS